MTGVRALIVGAGTMGRRHAAAIRDAGDQVSVVVDVDQDRASALAPSARVVPDLDAALGVRELFDVAVIATPSAVHHRQTIELLGSGCDVLVEKPHRVPGQDPAELASAAAAGGGKLFVGMSTRHWPGIEAALDAVRSGALGDLLTYVDRMAYQLTSDALPGWYFDRTASGGGVLLTNGVHALDRARAFLGNLRLESARLRRLFPAHGGEDHALVSLQAAGVPALIDLTWSPYPPVTTGLTVSGTLGAVRVGMDGSWELSTHDGSRSGPAIDVDAEPFVTQWRAFIDGADGFGLEDLEPTMVLVEQIYREGGDV